MAWSEQEVSEFQKQNNKMLAEINATLRPDANLSGKCGVFVQGQAGDLMTAMSVLKYREQVFGNKQIIWFANMPNCDCLRYAPISEVRPWPWPGNGLSPDSPGDFYPILCDENNKLNLALAKNYELTSDLDSGWFPAPWQLAPQKRSGIDYPNCSKKVFNIPNDYDWHPVLSWSDDEIDSVKQFLNPAKYRKKIFFETFAGSSQSKITEEMVIASVKLCKEMWPGCAIIFSSHKFLRDKEEFPEHLFDDEDILSAKDFTVRQCGILNNYVDLIISVSSGTTVACSAWFNKETPIIQCCGSWICSTKSLSLDRHFELVTTDNKPYEQWSIQFYTTLFQMLNIYR